MGICIDHEEIFKQALLHGISLFTGAGFSKLAAPDGTVLPDASELGDEICRYFDVSPKYKDDLEMLSGILSKTRKEDFQSYLRKKFTVLAYNPLYDYLNNIHIRSIITTNIDNIIQCVMDQSTQYSLHNIAEYGACKRSRESIFSSLCTEM